MIQSLFFLHFFFLATHKFGSNKLGYYSPQYYYRSLIIYIRNGRSCLHSVDTENYVWLYGSVNSNYLSEKWIQLLTLENNVRKSASDGLSAGQIACLGRNVLPYNVISYSMTWIFFEIAFVKRLQSLITEGYRLKYLYFSCCSSIQVASANGATAPSWQDLNTICSSLDVAVQWNKRGKCSLNHAVHKVTDGVLCC